MLLDKLTLLSDDQDLSQIAADYYSDILAINSAAVTTSADAPSGVGGDPAYGNPVLLVGHVTEDFDSAGAATLDIVVETDTVENFASPTVLFTSVQFDATDAGAELKAGTNVIPHFLLYGVQNYLRIKYTIGTATTTAGKITAGVTMGHQTNK